MTQATVPSADCERIAQWCREDWPLLRGGRIFLTGGTGFFGTWLLASFIHANRVHALGAQITVLTRDAARFRRRTPLLADDPAVRIWDGDVTSFTFPQERFTHIIHAAAEASAKLNTERPLEMIDTIVLGTRRTLELARHCGAKRFLFVSSGAIYGRQPPGLARMSEDAGGGPDPLHAQAAYGEAKRLAEQMCAAVSRAQGLEVAIARCWAFVGPWLPLDAHFAAGNLIRDALGGGPLVILGDGTTERSYLYAADLAAWLWRILVRGASLRPYNVGSDEGVSIAALAALIAAAVEPTPLVEIRGQPRPGVPIDRYIPSVSRARDELGLVPWTSLQEALKMTIAWHAPNDKVADRQMGQGL